MEIKAAEKPHDPMSQFRRVCLAKPKESHTILLMEE